MEKEIEERLKKLEETNLQIMTENFELSNRISFLESLGESLTEGVNNLIRDVGDIKILKK